MAIVRIVAGALSLGLMILGADVVSGQAYPNKPIRILSNEPGAGNDFVARLVAEGISGPLGQPVIIENRPGVFSPANGAQAQPEGYTILFQGRGFPERSFLRDNVPWN